MTNNKTRGDVCIMKKMIIFEPAMCCSTGLCGASIDQELLRISTVINTLKSKGITVERYNLSENPQVFVKYKAINDVLNNDGINSLPVTVIDDELVKLKEYPTNEEFCKLLDIPENYLQGDAKPKSGGCGCQGGCC